MFTYRAGGQDAGFALVADHVVVLIDRSAGAPFVTALYRRLREHDGGLDAALDAISAAEVTAAVAIVELREARERTVRVAVRGEYSVEMGGGGSTRLGGPSRPDWSMTEASGVHRFTLRGADSADTSSAAAAALLDAALPGDGAGDGPGADPTALPLRSGVVRATRVDFAIEEAGAARVEMAPEDETTRQMPILRRESARRADRPHGSAPLPAVPTPAVPSPAVPPPAVPDPTLPAQAVPARAAVEVARTGSPQLIDDDRAPATSARPASVPGMSVPSSAALSENPPVAAAEPDQWVFSLPDGSELDDRAPIVFGRRPWHRRGRIDDAVHVVVPSPRREISGEHLEIRVSGTTATARDLGSTNGTLLFSGDGAPRLVHAGIEVPLRLGDILDLGEGFCVTVGARRPAFARADAVSVPR